MLYKQKLILPKGASIAPGDREAQEVIPVAAGRKKKQELKGE
jgi:hypothetical protein